MRLLHGLSLSRVDCGHPNPLDAPPVGTSHALELSSARHVST